MSWYPCRHRQFLLCRWSCQLVFMSFQWLWSYFKSPPLAGDSFYLQKTIPLDKELAENVRWWMPRGKKRLGVPAFYIFFVFCILYFFKETVSGKYIKHPATFVVGFACVGNRRNPNKPCRHRQVLKLFFIFVDENNVLTVVEWEKEILLWVFCKTQSDLTRPTQIWNVTQQGYFFLRY